MSKSSTTSAPKNPTPLPAKSAWARGPPSSTEPSPRSQSPAPSTPVLQTHSRRPRALGQSIPIKDGVSIPRNKVGAVKQGSAVTFGSIDDVSAPAAVPPTKSESVKTFGTVPVAATGHINRKPFIYSRVVPPTASTSTAASSVQSAATPLAPEKPKIDVKKMFRNSPPAPPPNPPSYMQPMWGYYPPPHQPHPGSQMPHTGLPMSPRNPLSATIQNPSTPTLSHTITSPVHPPPHPSALAHSSNSLGLTSPPPMPSTPPISGVNRLDVGSRAFAPRAAAKLTNRKADGTEVSLENLTKSTPPPTTAVPPSPNVVLRQGSPEIPNRRPTSIRMETEDQHKIRLAEQEQNDKLKAEAADKEKKEKERAEAERKAKVAEEIRNLEAAARLEKEQKEQRRKQEEERVRKEAEALELQRLKEEEERKLKLKQEEERILKAKQEEEKALRLAQEKAKEEKERKEKEEQERLAKLAEETRLRLKEEAAAKAKDRQLEDGKDVDTETSKSMESGKDKPKDGLRINTTSIQSPTSNKRASNSRNRAIRLVQEQEDGLTTDQKIAMISCFMEDVVAADTYILLTDSEVRRGWIVMMLMK